MGTTNILDLNNRVSVLEKAVSGGDSTQANKSDIATEFNTTTNYTAGCFVYHDGKLYQFNADHAAGAWDPTDVVLANVTDQVVFNKATIDALDAEKTDKTDIAPEFNTTTAYAKGGLCYHEGTLYQFNQAHEAGAWNSEHVETVDIDDVLSACASADYRNYKSVTADGTKTYKTLINELLDGVTISPLYDWIINIGSVRYYQNTSSSNTKEFITIDSGASSFAFWGLTYDATSGHENTALNKMLVNSSGATFTNMSNDSPVSGSILYLRNKHRSS